MNNDAVITPTVIPDAPLPFQSSSPVGSQISASGIITPQHIADAPVPNPQDSRQVIGDTIDTQKRRLLNPFTFVNSGALNVGAVKAGVSGQVSISPDGIIGKDDLGIERFILDDTGQLVLKTGTEALILDALGIRSTTNFLSGISSSALSLNQTITTSVASLVTGAQFTITLARSITVFILARYVCYFINGATGDYQGNGCTIIDIDGVEKDRGVITGGLARTQTDTVGTGEAAFGTGHIHWAGLLTAGTHVLSLKAWRDAIFGTPTFTIYSFRFTYILLGS